MRLYCTSTSPIFSLICEVPLYIHTYFNWSHRWSIVRFYCTSTSPIGGLNCNLWLRQCTATYFNVLLHMYFNVGRSHRTGGLLTYVFYTCIYVCTYMYIPTGYNVGLMCFCCDCVSGNSPRDCPIRSHLVECSERFEESLFEFLVDSRYFPQPSLDF